MAEPVPCLAGGQALVDLVYRQVEAAAQLARETAGAGCRRGLQQLYLDHEQHEEKSKIKPDHVIYLNLNIHVYVNIIIHVMMNSQARPSSRPSTGLAMGPGIRTLPERRTP